MSEIVQPVGFSVRLVVVDYYLVTPIPELDVSISEFRGFGIKQVPVLRIFGSSQNGRRVCLHVHGVFPYLYIPCDESNPEPKLLYQIANSIDKAINISLKQANSQTQHVYKITLVKGIPYYGYHHKDHQFFKIFFYNPSFVKRAGDLLQSGAIMGVSFQSHESHINYVMQFLIDFNLYGMSFINLEHVKFRRKPSDSQQMADINKDLYLPDSVPYTSSCECEADCLAQHILNRHDTCNGNLGINPGLEALWIDERARHKQFELSRDIIPTPSQIRDNVPVTESHEYHNKRLIIKLAMFSELNNDNNDTEINLSLLNDTDPNHLSNTMNSSKLIYPAETPYENNCIDATDITLHHPMSILKKDYSYVSKDNNSESVVCEDIVIQYSQKIDKSPIELDNEDIRLMAMLQDLEHDIENDSILGTQAKNDPDICDITPDDCDMDNSIEENFDSVIDDSPKAWNDSYWDGVENFSQLDGTWDDNESNQKKTLRVGLSRNCKRKLVLQNDSQHLTEKNTKIEKEQQKEKIVNTEVGTIEKNVKKEILNLDEKFKIFGNSPKSSPNKCSPKKTPNKKSFINSPNRKSYRYSPKPIKNSPSRLKNYEPLKIKFESSPIICHSQHFSKQPVEESVTDMNCTPKRKMRKHPIDLIKDTENKKIFENDLCTEVKIAPLHDTQNMNEIFFLSANESKDLFDESNVLKINKNPNTLETSLKKFKSITSSQYDRINDYVPKPGTSRNMDSKIESSPYNNDFGIVSFYNTSNLFDETAKEERNILDETYVCNKNDTLCTSTTVKTLKLQYPTNSPEIEPVITQKPVLKKKLNKKRTGIILMPLKLPPLRNEVLSTMNVYDIPLHINMNPYYSNHKDVGNQIEIGQIVLKLKSKNLDQLKDFPTSIQDNIGINQRREMLFSKNNLSQDKIKTKDLDVLLSSNRHTVLIPIMLPPSAEAVKKWLISYQTKKTKNENVIEDVEEIIPEKIKICMPCSPGEDFDNSQMDTMSLSSCSLTPATPDIKESFNHSQKISDTITPENTCKNRRCTPSTKRRSLRLSVSSKKIKEKHNSMKLSQGSDESDIVCGQLLRKNSQEVQHHLEIIPEVDEKKNESIPQKIINDINATYKSPSNSTSEGCFNNSNGFKFSGENYQNAAVSHENEHLTILTLEVHTITRGNYNPDPEIDPICAIFYSIINDYPENHKLPQKETGLIAIDEDFNNDQKKWLNFYPEITLKNYKFITVEDERSIFNEILILINKWDPDILCGFEIEMSSWGYLFQRGFLLEINLPSILSRIKTTNKYNDYNKMNPQFNKEIKLIGRITLDVWRLLRNELALTSYTFESIAYHVLHERLPSYTYKTLTFWWKHPSKLLKSLTMEYYLTRVTGVIRILLQLDLIGRTSELARLFGIQWYEVLSRGSQFRVESMMIRLTRPLNFILVSPSVQQRAAMKAPECIPLILEPESRFYGDPVIVLDFQSLYPSMMIAYNYCYSTCIGRVEHMGKNTPFPFGATHLRVSPNFLKKLCERDLINWSPCGVGFVKPVIRKGTLPMMLQNILNTRFMVKKSMKKHKSNKTLQKILHNRQLGLKLIANVTYGYTAASFSGRMPCVDVGDSVVSKGRETLERAIRMVENTQKWNAKVVYGDTDSLFILVPGRSRQDAFDIGAEIAEAVTNDNPTPVKLKFEKVYHPCILQTKKRYVGYMYENKDQEVPEYEAKGIETVRRDGCPAVSKLLEKTLRILFETYDVSKVKSFICRKFQNIIEGKCNIQDFIFAREFRGMHAYKPTASVPALEISRRLKLIDHRNEPREGQRVPYIIINGEPGQSLLQSARCPRELLADTSLRVNFTYYITRVIIPPLNRCLTLIGADVNKWFDEMPRKQLQNYPILKVNENQTDNKKNTISQYFSKVNCVGCNCQTVNGLCEKCMSKPQETCLILQCKMNEWQRNYDSTKKICQSCCGRSTYLNCSSIDCPVLYHMNVSNQNLEQLPFVKQMEKKLLDF